MSSWTSSTSSFNDWSYTTTPTYGGNDNGCGGAWVYMFSSMMLLALIICFLVVTRGRGKEGFTIEGYKEALGGKKPPAKTPAKKTPQQIFAENKAKADAQKKAKLEAQKKAQAEKKRKACETKNKYLPEKQRKPCEGFDVYDDYYSDDSYEGYVESWAVGGKSLKDVMAENARRERIKKCKAMNTFRKNKKNCDEAFEADYYADDSYEGFVEPWSAGDGKKLKSIIAENARRERIKKCQFANKFLKNKKNCDEAFDAYYSEGYVEPWVVGKTNNAVVNNTVPNTDVNTKVINADVAFKNCSCTCGGKTEGFIEF